MSQRDGFTSGFLAGAFVGGLVGGVIGALVASQRTNSTDTNDASLLSSNASEPKVNKRKKLQLKNSDSIEMARRSLEDKIAQLNGAIDEVRQSLGTVNGNALDTDQEHLSRQIDP